MTSGTPDEHTGPRLSNTELILYRLDQLAKGQDAIGKKFDDLPERYVPRRDWETRNATVNDRFRDQGREIGDLRTEIRGRKVPWSSVVALIFSGATTLIVIIQAVGT